MVCILILMVAHTEVNGQMESNTAKELSLHHKANQEKVSGKMERELNGLMVKHLGPKNNDKKILYKYFSVKNLLFFIVNNKNIIIIIKAFKY